MADDRTLAEEMIEEDVENINILRSMPEDVLRLFNVIATRRTMLESKMGELAHEISRLRTAEDEIFRIHKLASASSKEGGL